MSTEHVPVVRSRGSALAITLAALAMVSALLVVLLNQSRTSRLVAYSSAGQYRCDVLAHTALDTITGDLRTEIAAGSTGSTSNNISIYMPTSNFTAVPCLVANQGFPNLLKQSSSHSRFWSGPSYDDRIAAPVRSAANNSSQTPAANGRRIKISQWNKPGLLGDPGSGAAPSIPDAYATPPDWVLLTRQGAVTDAYSLPAVRYLSDSKAGNANYAIGRYAYTIYNEGGLCDVNVAGHPKSRFDVLSGIMHEQYSTEGGQL